jgi:chromate transporter
MTDTSVLGQLARSFAMISLIAIGGINAILPAIRHEVVDVFRWMDDATFMQLFAVTQITPGPNVVIVSLVGWQVAGFWGLLVATLAMLLPACLLAFVVGRLTNKLAGTPGFKLAQDALVPVAIGLILAGGLDLAGAAYQGWFTPLLILGSVAFILLSKANPVWALITSALLALAAHYSGLFTIVA